MAFEQQSKGVTGGTPCKSEGERISDIENSRCKSPEVDAFLTYFLESKEAGVW